VKDDKQISLQIELSCFRYIRSGHLSAESATYVQLSGFVAYIHDASLISLLESRCFTLYRLISSISSSTH